MINSLSEKDIEWIFFF